MSSSSPPVPTSDDGLPEPPGGNNATSAAEAAVGPLLARANLLRMRGQWDEAIAVCTEALRRAPDSPTAHSLMGDIYEGQGRLDDALQWFGMAVDLKPDGRADREKLDRVIAAKRAALRAGERRGVKRGSASPMPILADPAAAASDSTRPLTERTLDWFDRVFPPGRSEGIARLIFAMSGALAVLLLIAAGFVYVSFQRGLGPRSGDTLFAGEGKAPDISPPPVRIEVPNHPSPSPSTDHRGQTDVEKVGPETSPSPSPTPSPEPTSSGTSSPVVTDGPAAESLRQALAKTLPPSLAVVSVGFLPRDATHAAIEVSVSPASPGETAEAIRERALRAAVYVGRSAVIAAPTALPAPGPQQIQRLEIRILLRPSETSSSNGATTAGEPIFLGGTTAALLRDADPVTAPAQGLYALFASTWWASRLVPGAVGP